MKPRVKREQEPVKDLGLKYIKRHSSGRTQGWYVAFLPRQTKESRFWADRKYGGRKPALEKAIAWRDEMMKKHRIPTTPRRLPVPWKRVSPSGVRGVYLNHYGWAYVTQVAEAPGSYPRAYFGFKTYGGQREALIAAVQHRITQEKRLYGSVVTPLPKWLASEITTGKGKKIAKPGATKAAVAKAKAGIKKTGLAKAGVTKAASGKRAVAKAGTRSR